MASYIFHVIFLIVLNVYAQEQLYSTLTLVNTGSSTPIFPIPTMNWDDWDEKAPFELTAMGMRELYLLGHELRRRYDEAKLLDASNLIEQVFFRMIAHDNAIQSGEAFLRGFLGNSQEHLSPQELEHASPPTKVKDYFNHTIGNRVLPLGFDTLPFNMRFPHNEDIFSPRYCSNANNLTWASFLKNPEVNATVRFHDKKFIELVKSHYKVNETYLKFPLYLPILESIYVTSNLYKDTELSAEELMLVENFTTNLYFAMRAGSNAANAFRSSPVLEYAGHFFDKIMRDIIVNPRRADNQKAEFVFTEDRMIASLLSRLGFNVSTPIPPSSILSFEVSGPTNINKIDEATVKLFYNDREVRIANCGFPKCEYKNFLAVIDELKMIEVANWCK